MRNTRELTVCCANVYTCRAVDSRFELFEHLERKQGIIKPCCQSINRFAKVSILRAKKKKNDTPFSHVHLMHFHSFHEIYQLFL